MGRIARGAHRTAFFLKTLTGSLKEDGGYGVPMHTFVAGPGDFTVVPTAPEEDD